MKVAMADGSGAAVLFADDDVMEDVDQLAGVVVLSEAGNLDSAADGLEDAEAGSEVPFREGLVGVSVDVIQSCEDRSDRSRRQVDGETVFDEAFTVLGCVYGGW